MSSIKSAKHPTNWRSTTNSKKNDIIASILLGGNETNTLNAMNIRDHTPQKMVGKLGMIVKNSSNDHDRIQAAKAIELLQSLDTESSLSETVRQKVLDQVSCL